MIVTNKFRIFEISGMMVREDSINGQNFLKVIFKK